MNWKILRDLWGVNIVDGKYSEWGNYFNNLERFPAALFDENGYVIFHTEDEYINCPYLEITKKTNCREPGISKIPGYKRMKK